MRRSETPTRNGTEECTTARAEEWHHSRLARRCFVAYGAFWSLMPVLCAELFGERSLGTIYSLFSLAPASASFAVTVGVATTVYAAHTPKHAPPLCAATVDMDDGKCFGAGCYQTTFVVTLAMCVGGSLLAFILARRMKPFYRATAAGEDKLFGDEGLA